MCRNELLSILCVDHLTFSYSVTIISGDVFQETLFYVVSHDVALDRTKSVRDRRHS